jgi:hypothetical protein
MSITIRQANREDAQLWLDLLYSTLGPEYPSKCVYDPEWVASQLDPAQGQETWVAEMDGRLQASVCFLSPTDANDNPVANLGRNLNRPESFENGSSQALLSHICELASDRRQMVVTRVPASDNAQQLLHEELGFCCVGYQPLKHIVNGRQGSLFYIRPAETVLVTRLPLSESLPQVSELASLALRNLDISHLLTVRDGATGYPLVSELQFHDATGADFDVWKDQLQLQDHPPEVSTGYNRGVGLLRVPVESAVRSVLGQSGSEIVAGVAYVHDELDGCVRILDAFCADDVSLGSVFQQVTRVAQEAMSASYLEVDLLMTAPRLLKTAEQLGFVPVAYLPAFYNQGGLCTDVVKLVKLNMAYDFEFTALTDHAATVVGAIDHCFEYYRNGVVVVDLLRNLDIFEGLGDGELRKLARLFAQKMYQPGDVVFERGDAADQAYVVLHGQVDVFQTERTAPIGTVRTGQLLGELAFLEASERSRTAVAVMASILLVVQRSAFNLLVQEEPHLGIAVMRNLACNLSRKLRQASTGMVAAR